MKSRKSTTPKSAAAKKTPPARKSAVKTPPPNPTPESGMGMATPDTSEAKPASASPDLKPEQPVEQAKALADDVEVTPGTKVGTGAKTKKTVVRKTVVRKKMVSTKLPASAKAVSIEKPNSGQTGRLKTGESSMKMGESSVKEDVGDESSLLKFEESAREDEPSIGNVEETKRVEDQSVMDVEETQQQKEENIDAKQPSSTDLKLEQPVEQAKTLTDDVEVTLEAKGTGGKTTKTVVRKTVARSKTPTSAKSVSSKTPKSEQTEKLKVGETSDKDKGGDAKGVISSRKEESYTSNAEESAKKEEPSVEIVEESKRVEDQNVKNVEDPAEGKEEIINIEQHLVQVVGKSIRQEDPIAVDGLEVSEGREPGIPREEEMVTEEMREETRIIEDNKGSKNEPANMEEDINNESRGEDAQCEDEYHGKDRMEECMDEEVLEEFGEEELPADDMPEHGEEAEALEEEHMELTAVAKERKIRKELEIFVGGLDSDAMEDDVKKVFENIGDVVEVRLHKNTSTDKNNGYAFVKFATKEQASRALSEMKNPLIRGKRCRTGPSEDNDSLFLGNICNTWTKEAINQKLKDYGIEGVENITLVPDARHEGLSRGFAFVEFSCHADAMLAYKRLQKPDVIFGHPERTAKVAFAEPLREPDPEVMAQVKSVFIDGLPPRLDEDRVRELMKGYGEIQRIMLARSMSTAKRKDYGFVDFTTHEAAVACVEGINNKTFGDGNAKTKVKARLSNPLPKTQAIKGGMCGGFRIGRAGAGSISKFGRGFGRRNRPSFQRDRGFYQRGNLHTWRMGFTREHELDIQYPPFQRREMPGRGGWRDSYRGAHVASSRGADRGHGMPIPTRRQPYPPGEGFNRAFSGRHFDDPYFFDDRAHGIKRPLFMTDQDPDYMEPSRHRPRLDYPDPAVPFHLPRYRDSFVAGSGRYPHDYYGPDYGEGSYSSFYGNDRPYGGGYYY